MVTDDTCEGPERLIHRRCVREDLRDVGLENHNVSTSHLCSVRVTSPFTEIIFGEDIVRAHPGGAPSSRLLHSLCVRDESQSERL
jgi:hypothetical protein